MKKGGAALSLAALLTCFTFAEAGHELPFYPSYYPQEIRIETVEPDSAAPLLEDAKIHAYVGRVPSFEGGAPADISYVESLGSYLVITFNPDSERLRDRKSRLSAARYLVSTLAGEGSAFVFHPYPVTPYHMDYLYHFDRAQAAKQAFGVGSSSAQDQPLRLRAGEGLAQELVRPTEQVGGEAWDATLEEIDVGDLVSSHIRSLSGWLAPPWLKEGWFHAYLLLADTVSDRAVKQTVEASYDRLVRGDYQGTEERYNLERKLVSLLTRGCERVVIGYTVKREYFNAEYSAGVENIAYDSHTGFNSAIFIRTVKLKDYPWNGQLRLGIDTRPSAAWNPMGGFTDPAGRLIWFAVGDPAFFPSPYNGTWMPNRIGDFRQVFRK